MVDSMGGTSTRLGGTKVYYLGEKKRLLFLNKNLNITGGTYDELKGLPEEYRQKFVYLAGGMGNREFANRDAIYLGRNDGEWTLKFRFHGNEYEVESYLPIEECPIVKKEEELEMKNYDREKFWKEFERRREF